MKFRKCAYIGILLVLSSMLTACLPVPAALFFPINWMPEEGVWYCDELQLQLSFEEEVESCVIVDENQKKCMLVNEQYSKILSVYCFKDENEFFDEAEMVFSGERVSLTDEEFVLRTEDGEKYVFVRID